METLALILQIALLIAGIFMMMIILLQRGRGGGLAGAFGGAGGQSAFGTKAGDVFTWITVVTATLWVLLAGIGGCAMRSAATSFENTLPDKVPGATATDEDEDSSDTDLGESSTLTTPDPNTEIETIEETEATPVMSMTMLSMEPKEETTEEEPMEVEEEQPAAPQGLMARV